MIGREIYNKTEFLEWIISSKNTEISGYNQSFYSGVSTIWMSKTIDIILKDFNSLRIIMFLQCQLQNLNWLIN